MPNPIGMSKEIKSKRNFYHSRKPRPPRRVPDDKKKSPNSLRRVLLAIRQTYEAGKILLHPEFRTLLANAWNNAGRPYGERVDTEQIFKATETGKAPLEYWHLECYARLLNIPTGVILLISRLTEHKRHVLDSESDSNASQKKKQLSVPPEKIIKGVRAFLNAYENTVLTKEIIDDQDIKLLLNSYLRDATDAA